MMLVAPTLAPCGKASAREVDPGIGRIASEGRLVYEKGGLLFDGRKAVAKFYSDTVAPEESRGIGGLLSLSDGETVELSYYENEGGEPTIVDVFGGGAARDGREKLFVICAWDQVHAGLGTRGTYYKIYVYGGKEKTVNGTSRAILDVALMKDVGEGFDGVQEGEPVQFAYKDRQSIIKKVSSATRPIDQAYQSSLALFRSGQKLQAAQSLLAAAGPKPWTIDNSTVAVFNDLGYFLEQAGQYKDAVDVLTAVIAAFPDRTVAYLNLADAYAGRKDTALAKSNYRKYIDLMSKAGRQAKIPKRVIVAAK
jgi:hypothetical protein